MSEPVERMWAPGDPLVLPEVDESAYGPDATPLEVAVDDRDEAEVLDREPEGPTLFDRLDPASRAAILEREAER